MRVPTCSARWFSFSVLLIAGAVGCAQPGTSVPTSPSSAAVPSAAAVGPGASYDATGTWCFVSEGEQPFQRFVHQDSNGNLHFLDDDQHPTTLERLSQGGGAVITYRLLQTIEGEGEECDLRVKGTAVLDTRSDTLTGHIRLKEFGCSNGTLGSLVTATKSSCPL